MTPGHANCIEKWLYTVHHRTLKGAESKHGTRGEVLPSGRWIRGLCSHLTDNNRETTTVSWTFTSTRHCSEHSPYIFSLTSSPTWEERGLFGNWGKPRLRNDRWRNVVAIVFGGGKVEGSFNFLAWIVSRIGKAEQVIGDGKVGLTFGCVGSEIPAYQRRAEDSKYRLRNNWFHGTLTLVFPGSLRSRVRMKRWQNPTPARF